MTSPSSPDSTPDLQPALQPEPAKPVTSLEFDEPETALPTLDVIPHEAPVAEPIVEIATKVPVTKTKTVSKIDELAPLDEEFLPHVVTTKDTKTSTTTVTDTTTATPTTAPETTPEIAPETVAASTSNTFTANLLANFFKLWARAVGAPADPNRAIIGFSVLSLVTLILLSRVYAFIDQLPVFAPAFELVGFFYTISVVIRYIRSAEDRSDLGKTINDLKEKFLGSDNP